MRQGPHAVTWDALGALAGFLSIGAAGWQVVGKDGVAHVVEDLPAHFSDLEVAAKFGVHPAYVTAVSAMGKGERCARSSAPPGRVETVRRDRSQRAPGNALAAAASSRARVQATRPARREAGSPRPSSRGPARKTSGRPSPPWSGRPCAGPRSAHPPTTA